MVNKIADIIYSLFFITPIIFSVLCLLKIVLVDFPNKNKPLSSIAKFSIIVPFITIASFLIYFIVAKFIFTTIQIPYLYNALGIVLFLTYFGIFFAISYGIGTLGHGGISPGLVVQELYKLIFKRNSR